MSASLLDAERLLFALPVRRTPRRGVLLFPHSYAVGMASLATHTLYARLNETGAMAWERAFATAAGSRGDPAPTRSVESGAPLRDFDVVAVTSSYELDWPTIPAALTAGGVAPLRRDRQDDRSAPLVIAGGPAISAAPRPLAALMDALYVGEVEPTLPELCAALLLNDRTEALAALAAIPGCYVPELHPEPAPGALPRRCAGDLDAFETASAILTPSAEFPNRFLVEIGRGCGRGCSFCLARQLYRPLRWRSLPGIMDTVRRGLAYTNDLGLIAAAVSDYPELPDLCAALAALPPEVNVSTSSIRLESASPELLDLLARGGQKTVTYAPEAATERLRRAIGKTLDDDTLFAAVERAAAAGLTRVRLYFMVGLPTETPDDRAALPDLAHRLTAAFPRLSFHCSVGAFSPRPHTPFEREPVAPLRDLRNWLGEAQRSLRAQRRVEVTTDSARWAAMQAALSRADERLGVALARHRPQGFSALVRALEVEGLDWDALTGPQDATGALPWGIVDMRCHDQ